MAAFGCTTTHQLGRASEAATVEALEHEAARPGSLVHVEPLPGEPPSALGYPIRALGRGGVRLDTSGAPVVVPLERVRSVSTYDRARGAGKGALVGGVSGFVVMGVLSTLFTLAAEANLKADGGDAPSNPVLFVLGLSSAAGLAGALVGAGFGAMAGQEDRYVVAR